MKAIDTNILIRFLVGDDPDQTRTVYHLFKRAESEKNELFVPLLVVLEVIWVLESVYEIERKEIIDAISEILLMPILRFEQQTAVQKFIQSSKKNSQVLSDVLIAHSAEAQSCESVLTFDSKASKHHLFELAE